MNNAQRRLMRASATALRNAESIAERRRLLDLVSSIEAHLVVHEHVNRDEWQLALAREERRGQ